eukprot:7746320-Pyramimonas_sp.AAC.1
MDNEQGSLRADNFLPPNSYQILYDASTLRNWLIPQIHYNLQVPEPTPMQGVEFTATFMMQEGCQAGTPVGGSDGSWIQTQSVQRDYAQRRVAHQRPVACPDATVASTCRETYFVRAHEQGYDSVSDSTE